MTCLVVPERVAWLQSIGIDDNAQRLAWPQRRCTCLLHYRRKISAHARYMMQERTRVYVLKVPASREPKLHELYKWAIWRVCLRMQCCSIGEFSLEVAFVLLTDDKVLEQAVA